MTAHDPAAEVARHVIERWTTGGWNASKDLIAMEAAREMAAPIRELHFRVEGAFSGFWCLHCEKRWPCETAKLVYTSEELS